MSCSEMVEDVRPKGSFSPCSAALSACITSHLHHRSHILQSQKRLTHTMFFSACSLKLCCTTLLVCDCPSLCNDTCRKPQHGAHLYIIHTHIHTSYHITSYSSLHTKQPMQLPCSYHVDQFPARHPADNQDRQAFVKPQVNTRPTRPYIPRYIHLPYTYHDTYTKIHIPGYPCKISSVTTVKELHTQICWPPHAGQQWLT